MSTLVRATEDLYTTRPNFDPDLARSWIENCKSFHRQESCRHTPTRLPTRVLDVSNLESGFR
jgi:hypothetical protein